MADVLYLTERKCAIFCNIKSEEEVLKALSDWKANGAEMAHQRREDGTLVVRIWENDSEFEAYVCSRRKPGDKVSKTLLGAYNYFRKIETNEVENKHYALKTISRSNTSIGVVAKPEFVEGSKHYEYILSLALRFDGLIFNGDGLVNEHGELVINEKGESSITMGKS